MKSLSRIIALATTLSLSIFAVSCSDSSSSAEAEDDSVVAEISEMLAAPERDTSMIRGYAANQACKSELQSALEGNGYSNLSVYADLASASQQLADGTQLKGTFTGYHGSRTSRLEGTINCTVKYHADGTTVLAEVSGDITHDGAANSQQSDSSSRGSGSSSRGSAGQTEALAQKPDMGQRAGRAEYQVKPRVDSWHPEIVSYLENPGMLLPGGKMWNLSINNWCSVGHFATDAQRERLFIVTAAHCGDKGFRWGYVDQSGHTVEFGHMVEYAYTGDQSLGRDGGYDIAIIEVTNPHARWTSQPPSQDRSLEQQTFHTLSPTQCPCAEWVPVMAFHAETTSKEKAISSNMAISRARVIAAAPSMLSIHLAIYMPSASPHTPHVMTR